jgi:prepilin-type N-terminal cleavage/methylation domain-containing protein/prepilin-type processing-associated H-X9-DG protein
MKKHNNNKLAGFTLLELLVVIAIIGILAAMMIPTINKVHEKGRRVQCLSNLKQLHTAAMNFSADNDGYLPYPATEDYCIIYQDKSVQNGHHTGWVDWYSSSDTKTYWYNTSGTTNNLRCIRNGSLFPYLGTNGDERVYVCPTMSRATHGNTIRSYGMNASLENGIWSTTFHSIKGPSRKMMFAEQGLNKQDGYKYGLNDVSDNWADKKLPDPEKSDPGSYIHREYRNIDGCVDWRGKKDWKADAGTTKYEHIGEYHDGRGHAVFCDGHVELVEYENTKFICSGQWENRKPIGRRDPINP